MKARSGRTPREGTQGSKLALLDFVKFSRVFFARHHPGWNCGACDVFGAAASSNELFWICQALVHPSTHVSLFNSKAHRQNKQRIGQQPLPAVMENVEIHLGSLPNQLSLVNSPALDTVSSSRHKNQIFSKDSSHLAFISLAKSLWPSVTFKLVCSSNKDQGYRSFVDTNRVHCCPGCHILLHQLGKSWTGRSIPGRDIGFFHLI
jgi:hypothetical protein